MAGWSGPDRGPPVPELQTGDQRAQGLPGQEKVAGLVQPRQGSHQDLQEQGGAGGQPGGQDPLLPQLHWGDTAPAQQSPSRRHSGKVEDCLFVRENINIMKFFVICKRKYKYHKRYIVFFQMAFGQSNCVERI